MKTKKLSAVIFAFVFVCTLVPVACAKLAYQWGKVPGDVNGDGKIDVVDLGIIAAAFGSTPGSPNWNPNADINLDGKVNIIDLNIAANGQGLYVKTKVDYSAVAMSGVIPLAGAVAKLFILNNNMFYASVEFNQIVPEVFCSVRFAVGQEGSGIQGAQDDRALSFTYGEAWTMTAFGLPGWYPWYSKGYTYLVSYALPTQGWFQFEMWGELSGTTTWTALTVMTGNDVPVAVMKIDFKIVNY